MSVWSRHPVTCFNDGVTTRTIHKDRPRRHTGDSNAESLILEGAERLLGTRTLQEISVGDIIEAAGVSRTTFYFYFSSKFAVVSALLESRLDEIYQGVRPWVESEGEASDEELRKTLVATTYTWLEHGAVMRAVIENFASDPELREQWMTILNRFIDAFAAHIDDMRESGHYPPGMESRRLAAGLAWANERVLYIASLGVDPRLSDPDETAEFLFLLWHGTISAGVAPDPGPLAKPKRRRSTTSTRSAAATTRSPKPRTGR